VTREKRAFGPCDHGAFVAMAGCDSTSPSANGLLQCATRPLEGARWPVAGGPGPPG